MSMCWFLFLLAWLYGFGGQASVVTGVELRHCRATLISPTQLFTWDQVCERTTNAAGWPVREAPYVYRRELLNEPTDNSGLDPDTNATSAWRHTLEIWTKNGSMAIGA